ncbi:MAG: hypothetical protein NXI00_23575 [Cytophagales bacterium]|nr:hypothetical protein [Cytophagales bacterium]
MGFNESYGTCPSSVTLDGGSIVLSVYLYDKFGTAVHGEYLEDFPMTVQMLNSSAIISTSDFSQSIDPQTGLR